MTEKRMAFQDLVVEEPRHPSQQSAEYKAVIDCYKADLRGRALGAAAISCKAPESVAPAAALATLEKSCILMDAVVRARKMRRGDPKVVPISESEIARVLATIKD